MGTNFFFWTRNKKLAQECAPCSYELTDEPDFGYLIHVGKRSAGWLPLFQAHESGINSVDGYKKAYTTGEFVIYTEYFDRALSWDEFEDELLEHNGGVYGMAPLEKIEVDRNSLWYDNRLPEYRPISHCPTPESTYKFGMYANDYFRDSAGFEFTYRDFS